jgi:phosphopantothenate-cysteine ligase
MGYRVVYLGRRGSIMPFTRHLVTDSDPLSTLDMLDISSDGRVIVKSSGASGRYEDLRRDVEEYKYYVAHNRLLYLPFTTVHEYLELLEQSSVSLACVGPRLVTYLAAAVSDFYIPHEMMAEHKIQSTDTLKLELFQVPKMLGKMKAECSPEAFMVSFKLETDHNLVIPKARKAISNYGVDLVVANELHSRRDKVFLVTTDDCRELVRAPEAKQIEVVIVHRIFDEHLKHALKSKVCMVALSPPRQQPPLESKACLFSRVLSSPGALTSVLVSCAFAVVGVICASTAT